MAKTKTLLEHAATMSDLEIKLDFDAVTDLTEDEQEVAMLKAYRNARLRGPDFLPGKPGHSNHSSIRFRTRRASGRTCEVCGRPISGRADRKYCGRTCSKRAKRAAEREQEQGPQYDRSGRAIPFRHGVSGVQNDCFHRSDDAVCIDCAIRAGVV